MTWSLRLLAELWRSEGPSSVVARLADRWAEARRRASFRQVSLDALPAVSVLQVASTPPAPWLGGVAAQLGTRLAAHARLADTALLFPWRDGMRLEVVAGGRRLATELPAGLRVPGADEDPEWAAAVEAARAAVGARLLHFEGAAGLPHASLLELACARPVLLAVHDFALVCPRPNLFDGRLDGSCGPCADGETCRRTLAAAAHRDAPKSPGWRERGAELLRRCRCAVYPSDYLRRTHERLLGSAGPRALVIPPGIAGDRPLPSGLARPGPRGSRPRVAFLGGGAPHKGAALFGAVVRDWARRGLEPVEWEVFGGGGAERLVELRRLDRVRVRGYYRHGSLPALLRSRAVDLCLLLPRVPESFSLTLSEALAAGVPVVAPAAGALAERLAGSDGLLRVDAGAEEVVEAVRHRLRAPAPLTTAGVPLASESAGALAALHAEAAAEGGPARDRH